jgi:hypothetical protein
VALGFEHRALCLRDRQTIIFAKPRALFALVVFWIGLAFMPGQGWTGILFKLLVYLGWQAHTTMPCFFFFYSFIHMSTHCLGHFCPPIPRPIRHPLPLLSTLLTSIQNLFCSLLQFCWREDINNNKKDIAFLLVKIKIAIQRDSLHCFHAQVYYNPNWVISTRPLHYFPVTFP